MAALTRVCVRCHIEKPIEVFPVKDRARGTRRSYCLPCCREYGREHYQLNRPAYLARTRARNADIRPRHRAFVREYLSRHPCVDCGINDLVVLEFDHQDPRSKSEDVGRLIHTGTLAELQAEVAKCDVRCGNCHRRKTLRQYGSYRLLVGVNNA